MKPLPYQEQIVGHLKKEEAALWKWFSSKKYLSEYADSARLELLKTTYRLDREKYGDLYTLGDEIISTLGLSIPLTLYQSQGGGGANAALCYIPGEAHIILAGPILSNLSLPEMKAVLAHELTHYIFCEYNQGEFLTADQLLIAMANDPGAAPSHYHSARLFQLYKEVYADRGSLHVTQDPLLSIAALVKTQTGLKEISAESYVRQAEEIFSKEKFKTKELDHPESFIRARALNLWSESGDEANAQVARMIEGSLSLDEADLTAQQRLTEFTRRLISVLLTPKWIRTDSILGHARLFFHDFEPPPPNHTDEPLFAELTTSDKSLRDYWSYVLLDFSVVDRRMEHGPLAAAIQLAEKMDIQDRFLEIAAKDLKLKKKELDRIRKEAATIVAETEKAEADRP